MLLRDNALNMVEFQQLLEFGRTSGTKLGDFDIVNYAEAFGAHGYRVSTEGEFLAALEKGLGEEGPSIIDVPVDYSHSTGIGPQLHPDVFEMSDQALDRFRAWAGATLARHLRHAPEGGAGQDSKEQPAVVYQTSTMAALLDGIYDGDVTIAELLTHGDFGLGTFNHLDGEMVILDGTCYHLRADGTATIASGQDKTPFAAVLWFCPDNTIAITKPADQAALTGLIDRTTPSPNLTYALRVTGAFTRVRTRTVMAQRPPYPPLTEATAHEPITDLEHVTGTLAGFRTPAYEQGISVAGYQHRQRTPSQPAPQRAVAVRRPVTRRHERANQADRRRLTPRAQPGARRSTT